jgi:hypothetical protein
MITRSFDPEVMKKAFELSPEPMPSGVSYEDWVGDINNFMLVEGDNVGLATYEYPGVYTVHWFFTARGREALKLAKRMLAVLFESSDARVVRGLTPVDLKAARWLAKQVGLTSHGVLTFADGKQCELMFVTKEEFYNNGHR